MRISKKTQTDTQTDSSGLIKKIIIRSIFILFVVCVFFYIAFQLSEQIAQNYLRSRVGFRVRSDPSEERIILPSQKFYAYQELTVPIHDDYLDITLSGGDVYRIDFSDADHSDFILVSTYNRVDGSYLNVIPESIAERGYTQIRVTPMRGDGEYWVQKIETHHQPDFSQFPSHTIIDFTIKKIEIDIKQEDFSALARKRAEALELGILISEDTDYVPAGIRADGKKDNAEIRLKGDWTEHLESDKWSFRIKMDDESPWGMKKFSVHRPETRNGVAEYLIHTFYRKVGGVAPRYDFVDVVVNGEYWGVYALEEFFDKRLIENAQRREGPIIKPNEDFLWERWAYYSDSNSPYLDFMEFDVFEMNNTLENQHLSDQAQVALTALNLFTAQEISAEEIFDMDSFAKYFAVTDLFYACHGNTWHNMRFYFNPIIAKLEPISFDEEPLFGLCQSTSRKNDPLVAPFFENETFVSAYLQYLDQYLAQYDAFIRQEKENLDQIEDVFKRDGIHFEDFSNILDGYHIYVKETIPTSTLDVFIEQVTAKQYKLILKKNGFLNIDLEEIAYDGEPLDIKFSNYEDEILIDNARLALEADDPQKFTVTYRTLDDTQLHTAQAAARQIEFSFYVAGHVYGSPYKSGTPEQDQIHPPFAAAIPSIAQNEHISFGILTGDTVYAPSEKSYQNLIAELNKTNKPFYVAPGNHDLDGSEYFLDHFHQTHQSFIQQENLFVVLAPGQDWALDDQQLNFLRSTVEQSKWDVENIFIFTHQLFWLEQDDQRFPGVSPNSWANKVNESNFWSEVKPLFSDFNGDVYCIAGDVGAFADSNAVVYERDGNLHFIASGMGGGKQDNYLIANVFSDASVEFDVIAINGDEPHALGDLTDY